MCTYSTPVHSEYCTPFFENNLVGVQYGPLRAIYICLYTVLQNVKDLVHLQSQQAKIGKISN